jgi:hypothetical protein
VKPDDEQEQADERAGKQATQPGGHGVEEGKLGVGGLVTVHDVGQQHFDGLGEDSSAGVDDQSASGVTMPEVTQLMTQGGNPLLGLLGRPERQPDDQQLPSTPADRNDVSVVVRVDGEHIGWFSPEPGRDRVHQAPQLRHGGARQHDDTVGHPDGTWQQQPEEQRP